MIEFEDQTAASVASQSPPPPLLLAPNFRSPEIKMLAMALAKAQALIQHAIKDSENPHFKSSYATLASSWDACRQPLSSNGLSIIQLPKTIRGGQTGLMIEMTTILLHSSGEWFESVLIMPVVQPGGPQQIGSTITYARRYSLQAMVSVAPAEEDDDGNAGQGKGAAGKESKPPSSPKSLSRPTPAPKNPLRENRDQKTASVENPGEFIATFGRFKGEKLKDCDLSEINSYINKIHDEALAKGKDLKGQVLLFIETAGAYLASQGFNEGGDATSNAAVEAFANSPEPSFDEPLPETA